MPMYSNPLDTAVRIALSPLMETCWLLSCFYQSWHWTPARKQCDGVVWCIFTGGQYPGPLTHLHSIFTTEAMTRILAILAYLFVFVLFLFVFVCLFVFLFVFFFFYTSGTINNLEEYYELNYAPGPYLKSKLLQEHIAHKSYSWSSVHFKYCLGTYLTWEVLSDCEWSRTIWTRTVSWRQNLHKALWTDAKMMSFGDLKKKKEFVNLEIGE